jgi:hypothetical protein
MSKNEIPWVRVGIWVGSGAIGIGSIAVVDLVFDNVVATVLVAAATFMVLWFQGLLMAMKYPYGPFADRDHWPFESRQAGSGDKQRACKTSSQRDP